VREGYRPDNLTDVNTALMKIVRALPYENNFIYSDNIDIMESMMKIPGVVVSKSTVVNMLKSTEKENNNNKGKF
jgi:hypothetical protein